MKWLSTKSISKQLDKAERQSIEYRQRLFVHKTALKSEIKLNRSDGEKAELLREVIGLLELKQVRNFNKIDSLRNELYEI